ncbi:MAG: AAA family ATPase [Henriciella sp.]|nr:AAA family ATPase [Henriciella sp.]
MANDEQPKTVLETILEWSNDRPEWQKDALRRIIVDGTPSEEDLKDLLALCRKEHGDDSVESTPIPLAAEHLPVDPGAGESIQLISLSNVVGVNQLAPGQTLEMATSGLTIIYGPNGTGKSGYSRIVKKACRARHAGKIMPDVYKPSPTGNATADLSVRRADGATTPIKWEDDGSPPALLSAITVFDRDCASVHIRKNNEVWFRPFGLDIPDDLAGVCQSLKKALESERDVLRDQRNAILENPTWSPNSSIGSIMSNLSAETALEESWPKSEFSNEDEARLLQLRNDLQQDGKKAAQKQQEIAVHLDYLAAYLKAITTPCADAYLDQLFEKSANAISAREAASKAATTAFSDLSLDGVGELVWRDLWESARRYSKFAREGGMAFPPETGDTCVLCHQPINDDTRQRMIGFEEFVQQDTQAKAIDAEEERDEILRELSEFDVHSKKVASYRKSLMEKDPSLGKRVLRYIAIARLRQKKAISQIEEKLPKNLVELPNSPAPEVEAAANETRAYAASLLAEIGGEERQALVDELEELQDLKQSEHLRKIASAEVARLKAISLVERCLSDVQTTAITRLGNAIADDLITPLMRDRFREEISELAGSRVRVEVVRKGGKYGSPQYGVQLYANPKANVEDVLSEGEQTCVALASYLTELANASHNSALFFDDPVTSLDHKWRTRVASRLAKEAKKRQVVVFTHDLIFVNDLHQMAVNAATPLKLAHLTRGEEGVGIINADLPWRAAGVPQRVDTLEKAARVAKRLYDVDDEENYRNAAHGIYDKLRAAWERALEDIVFAGVIMRHRDYINTKGLRRVTALEEADVEEFNKGFQKCCDYIESHDPSRGRDVEPPDPDEIIQDIANLSDWSKTLRTKMNAVK